MNKQLNKIKRKIEKMIRSHQDVYTVGSWSGNELQVTLQNLDHAFVKFSMSEDESKYKITTCFGVFPELNNTIYSVSSR